MTAAMTSFHAEECHRLASENEASAGARLSVPMQQRLPVPDL